MSPKINYSRVRFTDQITILIDAETRTRLLRLREALGGSMGELVRGMIEDDLPRKERKVLRPRDVA